MIAEANVRTIARSIRLCTSVALFTGCAALDTHQAKLDQKQLRDTLMDYNEEQILDNLIRAYNGRAIVHFDVKTVTATVASKIAPNAGYGRTSVSNQYPASAIQTTTTRGPANDLVSTMVQTTVGALSNVVSSVTRPFTSTLSAERTNNVLVDVKPQDDRKTYAAYIKFLNAGVPDGSRDAKQSDFETTKVTRTVTTTKVPPSAKSPTNPPPADSPQPSSSPAIPDQEIQESTATKTESVPAKPKDTGADLVVKDHPKSPAAGSSIQPLMHGPARPRPECVLVGPKCWNNCYYWVPVEYRKAFFELCVTTVIKGAGSSTTGGAKTEADENSKEIMDQLQDFNSLQRLKLGTPQ